MSDKQLPYICSEHPDAQIRHEWDEKHCVMNGYPAGLGWSANHQYFCNVCGRELSAEPIIVEKKGN